MYYFQLMFLKTLEKCVQKFINYIQQNLFQSLPDLAWQAALEKAQVKSDLITDIYMLLIIKKGIRGRICNAAHHYGKANNKYMQDYDENKQSSYLNYQDVNNFQSWAMS